MKKISTALAALCLTAIGCGEAPKPTSAGKAPDPAMMMHQAHAVGVKTDHKADTPAADKKEEAATDAKKEGEEPKKDEAKAEGENKEAKTEENK